MFCGKKKRAISKQLQPFHEWSWKKEKAVCHTVRTSGSHCFADLLVQRLGKWNGVLQDTDDPLHQRHLKARMKVYHPW